MSQDLKITVTLNNVTDEQLQKLIDLCKQDESMQPIYWQLMGNQFSPDYGIALPDPKSN